jgi:phosphoglycerol transferase MdoB-like AlkP superfamily enzyme
MPLQSAIGFDKTYSAYDEDIPALAKSSWGVDDKTMFKYVLSKLEAFDRDEAPWFASVVTSGTHPPYLIPNDFIINRENELERAIRYADQAGADLIDDLIKKGTLDNTIVVITADESRVNPTIGTNIYRDLVLNWIPLIIIAPHHDVPLTIHESFTMQDLPKTILDYLGSDIENINGRSALRSYKTHRDIVFGNIFKKQIFIKREGNKLQKCKVAGYRCFDISFNSQNLFKDEYLIESNRVYHSPSLKNSLRKMILTNWVNT